MSEALIASLQAEINRLNAKNAELSAEAKDRRIAGKKLQAEHDALKAQHATVTTEFEAMKTKATAGPTEKDQTIAELTGKLLTRDHRDAFASVGEFEVTAEDGTAKKYKLNDGVKPEAVWQLTGYKAEGATPDAKAVTAKYGEAAKAHPYLFAEVAAADPGGSTQPGTVGRREAGPGARTSNSTTSVTPSVSAQVDAAYGSRPLGRIA